MAATFHLENNKQGIIVTANGTVTGKEFLNMMNEAFSEEQIYKNYKYGINDFAHVEKFNISSNQLYQLAKFHFQVSKMNKDIIVGFIITKPIIYGLVRIWMAYAQITGWDIKIEKSFPEIREWVNKSLGTSG